ncbi:hypothetical protein PVK06_001935 [Gossypium arboreum]|uniref:Retrotransposon gag domain-containing protein n=1 Tax=Gossypium arboreum TaxID=29729 RepID=A0ABR0R299_GOSAR|nr:hypothetical protein PVK06_001935 [Gossypium arboreum]
MSFLSSIASSMLSWTPNWTLISRIFAMKSKGKSEEKSGLRCNWVFSNILVHLQLLFRNKLEQFFEAENVRDLAKAKMVMMHLEGRAFEWCHFFAQLHSGLQQLTWEVYAQALQVRVGSSRYLDPMTELVALKQIGTVPKKSASIEGKLYFPKPLLPVTKGHH